MVETGSLSIKRKSTKCYVPHYWHDELEAGSDQIRSDQSLSRVRLFAAAKSLQSCMTLCDPIDISPPGSPVPGILQATTLEWVAISFSNAWKGKGKVKSLSRVRLLATPWTAAYQTSPSMGFSRQEYWSGVPLPSRFLYREGEKSDPCYLFPFAA